ncbi:MAG: NmrA family NAD(P)-binding protein [Dehalococcoidia bacterium]|nr:NmrA family NAD(P)-binding protein [Dehalococcoidia bacterium]
MVVLVTGATGFIGRAVVGELLKHNYAVRCLVRTPGSERIFSDRSVEIYYGDIRDENSIVSACHGVEFVINLVSTISPSRGSDMFSTNVVGVTKLVSAIESSGSVKHLVHVSVLGANDNPRERYFFSKWKGEQEIKRTRTSYTILRPSVITGASDRFSNLLGSLVRLFPVVPVVGHGRNRIQPMVVEDFAYCIVASLGRNDLEGKIIEIGGDLHLSINEMIDCISDAMGMRRIKIHFPFWVSGLFCSLMNIFMTKPLLNRELARMLSNRNVTDIGVAKSVFGITPKAFSEGLHHLTDMNVKNATDHLFRNSDKRFELPKNRE